MHAFAGPGPWERLRTAKVPELKAAYERAVAEPEELLTEVSRLAAEAQIDEEVSAEEERRVLYEVRRLAIRRWSGMLKRSARLWHQLYNVAKATMHGYPLVAGIHIEGPPRAGEIADGVGPQSQRYAVAITSRVSGTHVTTDRQIIALGRDAVAAYRRDGMAAARLALELCETQAQGIMTRHAVSVPLRGAHFLDSESRAIAERLGAGEESEGRVTDMIDVSSWPSLEKVMLPSRAFLLSWREQTLPARSAAIEDAVEHFERRSADASDGARDYAVLAVIGEAMQPLEDLAYLATAWDQPFGGLANNVRATVYSGFTASSFWQRIHKRDEEYFDVLAGYSARDSGSGKTEDILEGLVGRVAKQALNDEQLAALDHARRVTRDRLRRLLGVLGQDWQQFSDYFYAYKHGGLAVHRPDGAWVEDDVAELEDSAAHADDRGLASRRQGSRRARGVQAERR